MSENKKSALEAIAGASQPLLAAKHKDVHRAIERAFDNLDGPRALELCDMRDACAQHLMAKFQWTAADLGANALSVSVEHFQELVKQGTYAWNFGYPSLKGEQ